MITAEHTHNPNLDLAEASILNAPLAEELSLLKNTPGIGHLTEIIHASTLFSKGAISAGGEISETVDNFLYEASSEGINTLYVVGIQNRSILSTLMMPHFANGWSEKPPEEHIGPSVFSHADVNPNSEIGSWENLKRVTDRAGELGITLIFDFIPHAVGLDSEIVRMHPEFIKDMECPEGDYESLIDYVSYCEENDKLIYSTSREDELNGRKIRSQLKVYSTDPDEEVFTFTREEGNELFSISLQRNVKADNFRPHAWVEKRNSETGEREYLHSKSLSTDGFMYWADQARLDTDLPEVIKWQAEVVRTLAEITPIIRADMAHLPQNNYWDRLQDEIVRQGSEPPEIWGEAYGIQAHKALAESGVHAYANFIREWLVDGEIFPLMTHLYNNPEAKEYYKQGKGIAYSANHDDSMGEFLPKEGAIATILCALPFNKIILSQGQRHGETHRYGADQHVPMNDYVENINRARTADPEYADHLDRIVKLMGMDVFRSLESDWSPVHLTLKNRELSKIAHIVRKLDDERVITVVDFGPSAWDSEIRVDLAASLSLKKEELSNYKLVNLLTDEVLPAEEVLILQSPGDGPGNASYMFAAVKS